MKNRNVLLLKCDTFRKIETYVAHDGAAHTHSLTRAQSPGCTVKRLLVRVKSFNSSNNNMALDSDIISSCDRCCSQVTLAR